MSYYCTRKEAEFYGSFSENISVSGMTYDEAINFVIAKASAKIDNYLEVPEGFFTPGGVEIRDEYHNGTELKYVGYNYMFSTVTGVTQAAGILYLKHKPIRSVRKFEENTSGSNWTTRTEGRSSDYLYNKDYVICLQNIPDWDYKNIRVTYTAGYKQTPAVIQDCCARLSAYAVQRIIDAASRKTVGVGGLTVQAEDPQVTNLFRNFFPSDIKRELDGLAPKRYESF